MLYLLDRTNPATPFPDVEQAEAEPNGLLAIGGDLSVKRLVRAYRSGVFPWYGAGEPILWWSPNPRMVLFPQRLRISRSLRKTLRKRLYSASMDFSFDRVIEACAGPRRDGDDTWLMPEMIEAYRTLHRQHIAHSVEIWAGDDLVGGLYGVALGRVFFGESMFSRVSDASKLALVHLCQELLEWDYRLIDCQVHTGHLTRLGAEEIPRKTFTSLLGRWCPETGRAGSWWRGRREIMFPTPLEGLSPP